MSDTWNGSKNNNWFKAGDWSTGKAPSISATGTQSVVISGTNATQPLIAYNSGASSITVVQTLITNGTTYTALTETQIGGENITLTSGANLTIGGIAMGIFYGNAADTLTANNGTMTGLHGATSSTPSFDSHMVLSTSGTDTLTVDTVNENFGEIAAIGAGNTLTISNQEGGNPQALHGLINYGLITIGSGAEVVINEAAANGSTVSNFYNAGWIVDDGGTLSISSSILDGASTLTSLDGYIEIGQSGNAILSGTVAAQEQVTFTDTTANTLQITAGTLFGGTVNNFGPSDTIVVNGFTSTSNVTLTTAGSVVEMVTRNGSVATTITLTGSVSAEITAGTNASGQEFIQSGATSFSSGASTLGSSGTTTTVANNGTITVTGATTDLTVYDDLSGTGAYFIDHGATLALDNASGNDAGQTVIFGTHGSASAMNTLILNGNTAGFGGTITGFGANDVIDVGGSVLPTLVAGEGLALSYNTTSGVLTVEATNNTTGSLVGTAENLTVGGTSLSTASFVALESSAGVNIELASGLSGQAFTFNGATNSNFETGSNFTGGVAPGDMIASGEAVTIAAKTASVSSGGVVDNGTLADNSIFIDTGSLTGTGTLAVGAGHQATLTGGASLGSITDAGSLTLGGSFSGPISLTSAAAAISVSGSFADTTSITGTGTLTVGTGATATLAGGTSLGAILDSGTIDATGATALSSINMEGNSAHSVVDFTGTNTATPLTNFGTTDDIILGSGALTQPTAGTGIALNYNAGVLTVEDTNASTGSIISTANVTVGGTSLSTASFVALQSTAGVNIELASGLNGQSFTFTGAGGNTSFENPANFIGGVAPGDIIAPGESVSIVSGTASVSSGGLTDNGTISVTGSGTSLEVSVPVSGSGNIFIDNGAAVTLSNTSATDSGLMVTFGTHGSTGAPNTLVLKDTSFAGTISGFGAGDSLIDAAATYSAADTFTFSNGIGTLLGAGGLVLETFDHFSALSGATSGSFVVTDGPGGNPDVIACFYAGVRLATPEGEVAVEDLRAGDMLRTADGTVHPVVWVGQSHVATRFADPLRFLPIRISAGALGEGLPVRDLLVSPDHALFLEGVLVQAGALVNDSTIRREAQVPATFTYYHVELAHHALLIADGALTESFVDNVDRINFHNWADRSTPAEPILEMEYPRAKAARQVPQSIRRRLAAQQLQRTA